MEKALGFRLMDSIKEVIELENSKTELTTALYLKKIDEKVKYGIESIESSLKAQASIYGVNYQNYEDRVNSIKTNYMNEIEKLRDEYEFQFANLQLELREALANQTIALVNAKKISDTKSDFLTTDKYREYENVKRDLTNNLNNALSKIEYDKYYKMVENLVDPADIYNQKKMLVLKKYEDYKLLIKNCETKINYCVNETFSEIDKIIKANVENALFVKKENPIMNIINKVINIFSGKSKFENKIKLIEDNMNELSSNSSKKIETIRNNTIEMVAEILEEKENLNKQVA